MNQSQSKNLTQDSIRTLRPVNSKYPFLVDYQTSLLAAIIESSKDAIYSIDLNGRVTSWNPAAEKMYGYGTSEIIGRSIKLIFPVGTGDEFKSNMKKLKKGIKIEAYDTVRINKSGQKIHVSISVSPLRDASLKIIGASVIARDISERIEIERRKDEFISIAAHELKTPITTLKGFCQILLADGQKRNSIVTSHFKKMDDQITRLTQLVNELLDVSYLKSGKIGLKKERFLLDDLVKEVASQMQYQTNHHQIIVNALSYKEIYADKFRLSQVLFNLISNAIKYSPKAKKIIVKSQANGHGVIVSVQDFGIGIFRRDQPKIFDRFFQARTSIRSSSAGLGLGLFISAEIIKRHQGEIWVESNKREGSTFHIKLPDQTKDTKMRPKGR